MDENLQARAEQLAEEFAGAATTIEELNGLMRLMMKSGLERMLNTEMAGALEPPRRGGFSRHRAGETIGQSSQWPLEEDGPRRVG